MLFSAAFAGAPRLIAWGGLPQRISIVTGDVDQAIELLGDDFVDHEQMPG